MTGDAARPASADMSEFFDSKVTEAMQGSGSLPFAAGRKIGHYQLLRELGQGGQGVVYLAEDLNLDRTVALKLLHHPALAREQVLARFRREAAVAAKLELPGICSIYDAGVAEGLPYIAMQYVEGESLAVYVAKQRPENGALTPSVVNARIELIEKVARILHACHEAGIIHRDVKPSNVMITPAGEPMLLDFGLARELEDGGIELTRSGDLFGTPVYMSPEQISANRIPLDRRTDVFSLGTMLYETLTLERPFGGHTTGAVYEQILTHNPPDPRLLQPAVSADLSVVTLTALEKERNRRYQTAGDLADELKRVRLQEPILARPPSRLGKLWRWSRRNRTLAAALLVAVFSVVGGLVSSLVFLGRSLDDQERLRESIHRIRETSDGDLAQGFLARESELWPRVRHRIPDMERWISDVRRTLQRIPRHRGELERLEALARLDDDQRDRLTVLRRAVSRMEALGEMLPVVVSRRREVQEIAERSLGEARAAWKRCRLEVARSDGPYAGLDLPIQEGLVPLGQDRGSGLWEFWVVGSGPEPEWRGADWAHDDDASCVGEVAPRDDMPVVLVLLPGGPFAMGTEREEVAGRNYDALVTPHERHHHEIRLDPHFMGKYEVTQAQWRLLMGDEPSTYSHGVSEQGEEVTDRHPVTNVTWVRASEFARRLGAELPTEVQWEYAARAGTFTAYWCGPDASSIAPAKAGNVADATLRRHGSGAKHDPNLDDGWYGRSPGGTFAANPFGLHDVIGNVREWCRDRYGSYVSRRARDGDGMRLGIQRVNRVIRGGCYLDHPKYCRSATRFNQMPEWSSLHLGLRLTRVIVPAQ